MSFKGPSDSLLSTSKGNLGSRVLKILLARDLRVGIEFGFSQCDSSRTETSYSTSGKPHFSVSWVGDGVFQGHLKN